MGSFKRKMRRRREREAKERRVVLQRLPERDRFGSRTPIGTCTEAAVAMWRKRWEREVRPGWKTHPVARLTENGVDYGTKPRPGDEVAYGMDPNREDDCLQAALATATQVPIEEVPDLDLDKRLEQGDGPDELIRESWERIGRWATERGMTLEFFGPDSLPAPRRRWVGLVISSTAFRAEADAYGRLVQHDDERAFNDHCLVMSHDRLIFDPSCSVIVPKGMQTLTYRPDQITYGISFNKEE